jgi:large subunit ribosomal protein L22
MKTIARLSNFGIPPLKARRFAGTIKGKPVDSALAILGLQGSPACQTLHKLLRSAIANAENNNGLAAQNLLVSNVIVDNGPMMKRIRPRARGRAYQILKRSCHVTIELDLKDDIKKKQQAVQPAAGAK